MKIIKSILTIFVLTFTFIIISCDVEPIDAALNNTTSSTVGTYYMTAFNSSIPTDLNGDGIASTNQMSETICFNGSFITLNTNNTFIADGKGMDINIEGSVSTIQCVDDGDFSGTWVLNGNQLTLTYIDEGEEVILTFTKTGNTLKYTLSGGEVIGTTSTGEPVYLTSNLELVYTK